MFSVLPSDKTCYMVSSKDYGSLKSSVIFAALFGSSR